MTINNGNGDRVDALHLLDSQTASSSSEIDFVLPSGYFKFEVVAANMVPATDNALLHLETSSDGGSTFDTGASDYRWSITASSAGADAGGAGSASDDADSEIHIIGNVGCGNQSTEGVSVNLILIDPLAAAPSRIVWQAYRATSTGQIVNINGSATRGGSNVVDAVRFKFNTGNIASGTFKLYGWVSS